MTSEPLNLKTIRREQRLRFWSDSDLAREAGISKSGLSIALRRGTSSRRIAAKLARALGLEAVAIFVRRRAS